MPVKSADQPVSLAAHGRLSSHFRSYSRPPDFRKPPDRPISVSVAPVECLPATHYPLLTTHSPLTTFRINTCKSVSKQRTLTTSRINTYKKNRGGGSPNTLAPRSRERQLCSIPLAQRDESPDWRSLPSSHAPRSGPIPRGLIRLRILPVTTDGWARLLDWVAPSSELCAGSAPMCNLLRIFARGVHTFAGRFRRSFVTNREGRGL